jgi:hypothetical protein
MDIFDIMLVGTYVLFIVSVIAAVVLPIVKSLDNPQTMIKSGIGIGALLVVFLLSVLFSSGEVSAVAAKFDLGATGSRLVGAAIIMVYLLGIGAIGGIIYTEFNKIFK